LDRLRELLAYAEREPGVLGVFLIGSQARDGFADESSDYDVGVVLTDDAIGAFDAEWPFRRGDAVEVMSSTLDGLRAHAELGTPSEWARYQYAHAKVLLDKTGEVGSVLAEKSRLPEDLARRVAADAIDAFVNSTYRSLRNRGRGLERAARLDAAESIPYLLNAVFALEGRIRPWNKYLEWELRQHPLDEPEWGAESFLERLDRLPGSAAEQHATFVDLENVARRRGVGEVIVGWEPDVAWLRGDAEFLGQRLV
jgi:predicted nucleotidyltransferase